MDLTEFLAARLDEDEALAKPLEHSWVTAIEAQTAAFSHHFDAKRMLREVAADRALLADLRAAWNEFQANGFPDMSEPVTLRSAGYYGGLLRAARIRATRFSDHPDYRDEWQPSVVARVPLPE